MQCCEHQQCCNPCVPNQPSCYENSYWKHYNEAMLWMNAWLNHRVNCCCSRNHLYKGHHQCKQPAQAQFVCRGNQYSGGTRLCPGSTKSSRAYACRCSHSDVPGHPLPHHHHKSMSNHHQKKKHSKAKHRYHEEQESYDEDESEYEFTPFHSSYIDKQQKKETGEAVSKALEACYEATHELPIFSKAKAGEIYLKEKEKNALLYGESGDDMQVLKVTLAAKAMEVFESDPRPWPVLPLKL